MSKYKIQLSGSQKFDVVIDKGKTSTQGCTMDFEFLQKQLEFIYSSINGIPTKSLLQREIIGKQLWKIIGEKNVNKRKKPNFFGEDPEELFKDKTQITITYESDKNMDFECSIPWELFCFAKDQNNYFLHGNEHLKLIRKYIKPKSQEIEKRKVNILLCIAGPTTKEDAEKMNVDIIDYTMVLTQLNKIKEKFPIESFEISPFKDRLRNTNVYTPYTWEEIIDEILKRKPSIVHIITHGIIEDNKASILFNTSIMGNPKFDWVSINKINEKLKEDMKEYCPPIFILEICQIGRSKFPLMLSSIGAEVVIANMFNINQVHSQNFISEFYSNLFNFEEPQSIVDAFHNSRRKFFTLNNKESLSYYGLPILFYNLEDDFSFNLPKINEKENDLTKKPLDTSKKEEDTYDQDSDIRNKIEEELKKSFKRYKNQWKNLIIDAKGILKNELYMARKSYEEKTNKEYELFKLRDLGINSIDFADENENDQTYQKLQFELKQYLRDKEFFNDLKELIDQEHSLDKGLLTQSKLATTADKSNKKN